MTRNDVLIRLRYALNITDLKLAELFELGGRPMPLEEIRPLFLKEDEPGYVECDGPTLAAFLEGLIVSRRGRREPAAGTAPANHAAPAGTASPTGPARSASSAGRAGPPVRNPSNNDVLKAVRVALELRDDDIAAIMRLAGVEASKAEIGALFRRKDQGNYRPCGDQFLRNFLLGLTRKYRV